MRPSRLPRWWLYCADPDDRRQETAIKVAVHAGVGLLPGQKTGFRSTTAWLSNAESILISNRERRDRDVTSLHNAEKFMILMRWTCSEAGIDR